MTAQNKNNRYPLRSKAVFFLFAFLILCFFGYDFGGADAEKSAIVICLGIDTAPEGYELSAQLAVSQSKSENATQKQSLLTVRAPSVAEAIDTFSERTGWRPLLSFCNLILISRKVAEGDLMEALEFFLRSDRAMDSALLVIADGSPKELLKSATPLDEISSFGIQKVIFQGYAHSANIHATNLKEFSRRFYTRGTDNAVPLLSTIPLPEDQAGVQDTSQKSAQKQKKVFFDATKTALFSKQKLVASLTSDETLIFNLLSQKTKGALLEVKSVPIVRPNGERNVDAVLDVVRHGVKTNFSVRSDGITMHVKLDLLVKLVETRNGEKEITDFTASGAVPNEILAHAEQKLLSESAALFHVLKEANCDAFSVGETCNKKHHKAFSAFLSSLDEPEKYFEAVDLDLSVNVRGFSKRASAEA